MGINDSNFPDLGTEISCHILQSGDCHVYTYFGPIVASKWSTTKRV